MRWGEWGKGQVGSKRNTSQCLRTVAKNNKTQSKKTLLHRLLCLLKEQPPAAKCLSARQTSTQSPQKPSPASVTIVTGHRCRPVLINVHGTPSCLIEVLLHPTRSPYGLKLRDSGRCLEFWNKSRSARGGMYRRSTIPSKLVTPTNTIAFSDFAVWFLTLLRIHTQFWLPKEVSSFCLVAEWVRLGIGTATASFVEL